jgi:hypothetical protein
MLTFLKAKGLGSVLFPLSLQHDLSMFSLQP